MTDVRQFVVQRHDTGEAVHWDLMLEQDEDLATWQVPVPPEEIAATPVDAQRIVDHPKRLLTYEGPLRSHPGSVRIHDRGTYSLLSQSDNDWRVSINGQRMKGLYLLRPAVGTPSAGPLGFWNIVRTDS